MSNVDDYPTDHTLYEVYQQPIALDRFSMHDVGSNEAAGMKQNYLLWKTFIHPYVTFSI
jgi:hypothetical protein